MIYRKKFTPEASSLIRRLPPDVKPQIRSLTDKIIKDPNSGKALRKDLKGYYSIRHSKYRLLYEIDLKRRYVIIQYVGLRRNVYEVFSRFLKEQKQ